MLVRPTHHSLVLENVPAALITKKSQILLTALILWFIACAVISAIPRSYKAQATVSPAETTGIAISSLLSPAPFSVQNILDQKPTGNFSVYLASLRSREAAHVLLYNTRLPQTLLEDRTKNPLSRLIGEFKLRDSQLDEDLLLAWLERNVSVTQHPSNAIWTIEVLHQDQGVALEILKVIHETAERRVREEMENMIQRRVAWLTNRVSVETDTIVRNTLYELIGQTQRHAAIVASDTAIAARLVSAPAVESQPSVPNRLFLFGLSFITSFFISVATWGLITLQASNRLSFPQESVATILRQEINRGQ